MSQVLCTVIRQLNSIPKHGCETVHRLNSLRKEKAVQNQILENSLTQTLTSFIGSLKSFGDSKERLHLEESEK